MTSKRQRDFKSLIFGIILLLLGTFVIYSGVTSLTDNKQKLIAPKGVITIEKAETAEQRKTGLSYRESLNNNSGMLFIYDESSVSHCLWMKDMNFAIDMIWLDDNKNVVHIEENIGPDTYPDSFCPDEPAKYSLELNAFRATELGIKEGSNLKY